MTTGDYRVFISAVTSEFELTRNAVAADLRARGLLVHVQSDFTHGEAGDTLLRRLHDYIRDCSAVVCIVGARSAGCPPPAAVAPFAHMLPEGMASAPYTQWEFFFARYYNRRLHTYIADKTFKPFKDKPTGENSPELQEAFVAYVKTQGIHWTPFATEDQLGRASKDQFAGLSSM